MTAYKGAMWIGVEVFISEDDLRRVNTEEALAEMVRCKAEGVKLTLETMVRKWRKENLRAKEP